MAQTEISPCSSVKVQEVQTGEVNDGGQTQSNASAEPWLIQVKRMFEPQYNIWQLSKNVCIYRVPKCIMINKKKAYAPFNVSLGPYNHNMNTIDQHKVEAVHRLLARLQIDVTILVAKIRELESEIRGCYEEAIEWDGETLSWMLTMDGCFILEFFRSLIVIGDCFSLIFQENNHTNTVNWDIEMDIMKLENQIPLFVLTTLLRLEFKTDEGAKEELTKLLEERPLFRGYPFNVDSVNLKEHILKNPYHLLDLYRMVIKHILTIPSPESAHAVKPDGSDVAYNISRDSRGCGWPMKVQLSSCVPQLSSTDLHCRPWPKRSPNDSKFNPSADLLVKAGIEFQPGRVRFEKKRFGKGTLFLPEIRVDDTTEILLRNLMAYEECQRCSWSPEKTVISQYFVLLDHLIDLEKDVSVLRKSQVVVSGLGSDENIARMFNEITKDITEEMEEFEAVLKQAREHYNNRWKVWMNQFKEEHFSKPWSILSFVAAILALGMTFVQTVYSVKK